MLDTELKKITEAAEKRQVKVSDYLMINDAAEYIGVSANTLRNWERAGKFRPMRNSRSGYRLYKREDLDAVLNGIENPEKD